MFAIGTVLCSLFSSAVVQLPFDDGLLLLLLTIVANKFAVFMPMSYADLSFVHCMSRFTLKLRSQEVKLSVSTFSHNNVLCVLVVLAAASLFLLLFVIHSVYKISVFYQSVRFLVRQYRLFAWIISCAHSFAFYISVCYTQHPR